MTMIAKTARTMPAIAPPPRAFEDPDSVDVSLEAPGSDRRLSPEKGVRLSTTADDEPGSWTGEIEFGNEMSFGLEIGISAEEAGETDGSMSCGETFTTSGLVPSA